VAAQGGVGKDLAQPHGQLALVLLRQVLQVNLEGLAKLEQERDRDGPLVVLDQVQVAGADAELFGHLLLGQAAVLAQPANLIA
jgi:hypothetical protein